MKKTIKNILIILLVFSMLFLLAGCGEEVNNNETYNEPNNKTKTTELSIGEWDNNVYTNNYLGLKFTLLEGWKYSTQEEIAQIMNIGKELLNDEQKLLAEISELQSVTYMMANDPNTANNVSIIGEKTLIDLSIEYYIEQLKTQLTSLESMEYEIGETSTYTIGDKEYTTLQVSIPKYNILQKYYVIKQDKYFNAIIVTSTTGEQGINEIVSCFE